MNSIHQSESERLRRREYVRDAKAAVKAGQTIEQHSKSREDKADEWAEWLHQKMDEIGVADPTALLPDILARIDQSVDDRIAAAINDLKTKLRAAVTP
jgi:hypothetical protein